MRHIPFYIGLLFFAIPAVSAPSVNTRFDYYHVYLSNAASIDDIRVALNSRSPIRSNNTPYHGHADWHVRWKFRWKRSKNVCYVSKISTSVDLTYIMPDAVSLPIKKDLRIVYQNYYKALLEHEKGHGEIAVNAAREIERVLGATRTQGDCSDFTDRLNAKGHKILNAYNSANRAYDRKTGHGRTQGAYLRAYK